MTPEHRQWLTIRIITMAQQLSSRRVEVEIHCVSRHAGVRGNEWADKVAKEAAEGTGVKRSIDQFTSLAHVN